MSLTGEPGGALYEAVIDALKDIYDTAGIRTTCHSKLLIDNVPGRDSVVAAKLASGGGVLLGVSQRFQWVAGYTPLQSGLLASVLFVGHSLISPTLPTMMDDLLEAEVHYQIINGAPLESAWKDSRKAEGEDDKAIQRLFAPEFRNRLDAIVAFKPLQADTIRSVVTKFILQLEAQLADRNITIELTDEAADWLAKNGFDELYGARPLARVIQDSIKKPLADDILFGRLTGGGHVKVQLKDGKIDFDIAGPSGAPAKAAEEETA